MHCAKAGKLILLIIMGRKFLAEITAVGFRIRVVGCRIRVMQVCKIVAIRFVK